MPIRRTVWLTDIHLNFVDLGKVEEFCRRIAGKEPDGLLLGGDIGEAQNVTTYLRLLEDQLECPIFFVLGNHDFYNGSISEVRQEIKTLVEHSQGLCWLSDAGVVPLTERICLIGHDAWADGRLGDYERSQVELNDYLHIEEFAGLDREKRLEKLHELGDAAADYFRQVLPRALKRFRHVVVLIHVPPFAEACWHEGRTSDENYLPHFSCKSVGKILEETMRQFPDCEMTVLCGHTHGSGEAEILPNLLVKTGGATYGEPQVQEVMIF